VADKPKLSQEEVDRLIAALQRVERKRKIILAGYLLAVLVLIGGEVVALYIFGTAAPGAQVAWVFFIPFALVGLIFWLIGRATKRPSSRREGP
jgi:hypothetical protein